LDVDNSEDEESRCLLSKHRRFVSGVACRFQGAVGDAVTKEEWRDVFECEGVVVNIV
jgi:hypothetical protein